MENDVKKRFQFRNSLTIDQLKAAEKGADFNVVESADGKRLAFYCGSTIGAVSEKAKKALDDGDVSNLMVAEALDTQLPEKDQKWIPILYVSGGIRTREVLYKL